MIVAVVMVAMLMVAMLLVTLVALVGGGDAEVVVIISALAKAPMGSHPQALTAFPQTLGN